MNQDNVYPQNLINELENRTVTSNTFLKQKKEEYKMAEDIFNLIRDLKNYITDNKPFHILDLLNEKQNQIVRSNQNDQSFLKLIEKIKEISVKQSNLVLKRFPAYLEEAAKVHNIPIDSKSRHPRYSIKSGFFQLEIDDRRRKAKILDNEGVLAEFPADINAIAEIYKREEKRIFGRKYDGMKFLKKLRHHYLILIEKAGKKDGDSLPIRKITSRLGKNEKGFKTDEFLADLSKLIESGPFKIDGCRIDLQQTKNTIQGMLLHGSSGRGYVGFIVFRRI
jgi:hypothetical protein